MNMVNLNKNLTITSIREYQNPISAGKLQIADSPHVWPPYSAFHLAGETFPAAQDLLRHNGRHRPIIVDVGTGSGILAILAKQTISAAVCVATDLNVEATRLAQHNWRLNNLPENELITMTADGIDHKLLALLLAQGKADVLIANLPQQPLVNGEDLAVLRDTNSAAWNIDPSHDPDGLGILSAVLSEAYQVIKPGGVALVSASSKQNIKRITDFLERLKYQGKLQRCEFVSATRFDVPKSYDPKLIEHWAAREQADGVQRLFTGPNGPQYEHYNIVIHY